MSGWWLACFRVGQVWVAARSNAHCACSRAGLDRMEIEAGGGVPASDADGRHARAGATLEIQDTKTSPSAERGGLGRRRLCQFCELWLQSPQKVRALQAGGTHKAEMPIHSVGVPSRISVPNFSSG